MTMTASAAPRALESYLCGQWIRGAKAGSVLLDAATGAPVASIDASGLDFAAALAHGREQGGHSLRRMSFHERAAMLKALGQYLMERKEEFYQLSAATGATRPDSWIDIEGGIGTCWPMPRKAAVKCPTRACWWMAMSKNCRATAVFLPSIFSPRSKAWRCISMPIIFPVGACWKR